MNCLWLSAKMSMFKVYTTLFVNVEFLVSSLNNNHSLYFSMWQFYIGGNPLDLK